MTDIEKRAFEAYPLDGMPMKEQQDKREGYIKACKEYESLPKVRGWVYKSTGELIIDFEIEEMAEVLARAGLKEDDEIEILIRRV